MLKSSAIIGVVFLIVGGLLFGWVSAEQRKEDLLVKQRSDSYKANLSKIDAVVGDQIDTSNFEDLAYSGHERETFVKSASKQEKRQLAMTLSSAFGLTGGAILSCCLLFGIARLAKGLSSRATRAVSSRGTNTDSDNQPAQADDAPTKTKNSADFARWKTAEGPQQPDNAADTNEPPADDTKETVTAKHSTGQPAPTKTLGQWKQDAGSSDAPTAGAKPAPQNTTADSEKKPTSMKMAKKAPSPAKTRRKLDPGQNMALLLSDEESVALEDPSKVKSDVTKSDARPAELDENVIRLEESMKTQNLDFEKRMEQFSQMAQNVQQTALANARPVEQSIRELSQQVSAIREYADHQQERVKKLQDGYDWNIIRNFCLRIIRCVDNLDNRIKMLGDRQVDATALEEVRDELLFALESTGVEQFQPEINSDYRGQEKNTEVIREKEECDDPDLKGRIAVVLRPGYHYFIDDDNVKLIRTAQVKLYC